MNTAHKPTRSRLYKQSEKKSRKNLLINLISIIIVVFLIAKFGIPFLINFTLFISDSRNNAESVKNEPSFVASPILNPMSSATNSAQIVVSGASINSDKIVLYLNNIILDEKEPKKDGTFSFDVNLTEEENTIKAKAIKNPSTRLEQTQESDFSETIRISLKNSSPTLNIESPANGQTFPRDQKTIEVKGETDPMVRVTVNEFWAITNQSNQFLYTLPLKDGENIIKIVAKDEAGNKTEKEVKVTYNP